MVRFAADVAAAVAIHEPPRSSGAPAEGTVRPEGILKMTGGLDIH